MSAVNRLTFMLHHGKTTVGAIRRCKACSRQSGYVCKITADIGLTVGMSKMLDWTEIGMDLPKVSTCEDVKIRNKKGGTKCASLQHETISQNQRSIK